MKYPKKYIFRSCSRVPGDIHSQAILLFVLRLRTIDPSKSWPLTNQPPWIWLISYLLRMDRDSAPSVISLQVTWVSLLSPPCSEWDYAQLRDVFPKSNPSFIRFSRWVSSFLSQICSLINSSLPFAARKVLAVQLRSISLPRGEGLLRLDRINARVCFEVMPCLTLQMAKTDPMSFVPLAEVHEAPAHIVGACL